MHPKCKALLPSNRRAAWTVVGGPKGKQTGKDGGSSCLIRRGKSTHTQTHKHAHSHTLLLEG